MYILHENDVWNDIRHLDDAWDRPDTFVFLPDKSGVSSEWILDAMQSFPEHLHQGHFALLTSGSTGQPKIVIGAKARSENLARTLHLIQDSEPVDEAVLMLPLIYCYAFVNQWLWSRVMKRKLLVTRGFKESSSAMKTLLSSINSMLCLVGAQSTLIKQNFGDNVFPGVIRLHFAGGQFPQHDIDSIRRYFPNAQIFNNYGCAEAMPRLTIRRAEESSEGPNIGKPLPGIKLKTDECGRIFFQSIYSSVAYYDDYGYHAIGTDDWIPSGDLGEEIEDGYWRITGRANEVFKRYGVKIALPTLLRAIHSKWHGQAVFYREKDPMGEDGHVLVLSPEPTNDDTRSILQAFRKNFPRTHWPIRLESVKSFTTLPNGKIDVMKLSREEEKNVHWRLRI
ncbi:D-alanine--poly(phosphoribitol) ligase subunit 1 [uncultured archaeon]|nr:D-alanine--poly(phosphoribitol) ligase subunit 1 [uncultured archaeon]